MPSSRTPSLQRVIRCTSPAPPFLPSKAADDAFQWMTRGSGNYVPTIETGFLKRENSSRYDIMVRRRPDSGDLVITLTPPSWENCNISLRDDTWGLKEECAAIPEADIEEIAYGIEQIRVILAQEPLKSLQAEIAPGPSRQTRAQIKDWVRTSASGFNHLQGTLRMGNVSDRMAVLDDRFKFRGVDNLWVSDNSVFPWRLQADAQADAVMAGERGSDFIIRHFGW